METIINLEMNLCLKHANMNYDTIIRDSKLSKIFSQQELLLVCVCVMKAKVEQDSMSMQWEIS